MISFSLHFCALDLFGIPLSAKTWRDAYDEAQLIVEKTPNVAINAVTIERHWRSKKFDCWALIRRPFNKAKS